MEKNSLIKKYHSSHMHHMNDFKKRFLLSLAATIPILLLSPMIWKILGFKLDIPYREAIIFVLSTFVYFYGGKPFLKGSFEEIKRANPGMMILISLAISVAYFYSTYALFDPKSKEFFGELATLIDVMLIGHYIEAISVMGAANALQELVRLIPHKAHKMENGKVVDIEIENLKIDDTILIKPGEKFLLTV